MTPLADYFKSLPTLDASATHVDEPTLMDGHLMHDRFLYFDDAGVLFAPWDAVIAYCGFSGACSRLIHLPKKLSREVFGSRPDDVSEIARSMLEWRGPLG